MAEWKATLDAAQQLDMIGAGGPVGYWGVSMGTRFGVPFVAEEPRVSCAVFGLFGVFPGLEDHKAAAERIRIPLMFAFQSDDELMTRDQGLASSRSGVRAGARGSDRRPADRSCRLAPAALLAA